MGEVRARLGCAALTLTLMLNLFPVTVRAGSTENCPNGAVCTHEAAIGTTHYDTLEEAAAAAASGQTIVLHTNVELEAQVDLPDGVTLDGRGRKISAASDTWSSANPGKYMLVGGDRVTIMDVTLDGAGAAAGCLQFFKAREGSLQGLVTLKNAQGLGLNINASQVTAEGVLTLKGNGWGDIINVGWGSNVSGVDRCSFDGSAAALEGVAAVYTDHSDVSNAGGDLGKFSIRLPASFAAATQGELDALDKAILYAPAAAQVEDARYLSLAGALQAARDGGVITLLASSAGNRTIDLSDGRRLTLDLNGFDVGFAQGQTFRVSKGGLTITGRGRLYEQQPQTAPVTLLGSHDPDAEGHTTLTVDKNVTLEGWSGVWIGSGEEEHAFGVSAAIYGTANSAGEAGGHAVHLSQTAAAAEGNVPQILLEGAALNAPGGAGLYLGGCAQTTVNSSTIRADGGDGIVLSGGELAIHGNTVVTGGDGSDPERAALAVVQHPEKLPVALTVTGGAFTGGWALLEHNGQSVSPEEAGRITLNISGGRFHGRLYSRSQTGFITGGVFTSDPSPYLAQGFAAQDSGDAVYHYAVTAAGENPAQVVAGEAEVSVSDRVADGEEQALAQQVAEALKDTQQGGGEKPDIGEALRAAASTVANRNPVTPEQGKQALDDAGIPSGDVTIVVRPYLEISVADVSIQNAGQTVTLDITPKYITLAAADPENIQLEDTARNAVQMGQPQTLTITKPVTVTLPLTDGFAEDGRLYVRHEKDSGAVYYYRGAVADNVLTFTNPNGFSRFSYSTALEVVADVNGRGYPTLEEAIEAVEEGGAVELLVQDLSAQVAREVRFTVTGAGADTVQLTAGPGYEKRQAGNTYTFTYVGGGSEEPNEPEEPGQPGEPDEPNEPEEPEEPGQPGEPEEPEEPGQPGEPEEPDEPSQPEEPEEPGDSEDSNDSGGSGSVSYQIVVSQSENGTVTVSPGRAPKGGRVTVTVKPDQGYELRELTATGKRGGAVELTNQGGGRYTFVMPSGQVTVAAVFAPSQQSGLPFADVEAGAWYYESIAFAYGEKWMVGAAPDRFGVDEPATRAMAWTVLAAYSGADTSGGNPWYLPGRRWAVERGVSDGADPDGWVTREQLAVMLWRAAGSPSASGSLRGYEDADSASGWAAEALAWAVDKGILTGMGGGVLAPQATATRAQTAVMLTAFVSCMEK